MKNLTRNSQYKNWYPLCLKTFQPKMSAQAQDFEIFEKSFLWVSSRLPEEICMTSQETNDKKLSKKESRSIKN